MISTHHQTILHIYFITVGSGDDISSTSESYENGLTKSNEYNNSNTSPESTLERTGNPMETKQLEIVATQLLSLKADIEVGLMYHFRFVTGCRVL